MEVGTPAAVAGAVAAYGTPHQDDEYTAIFRSLPAVDFAFAYGSGVFKQAGDAEEEGQPRQPQREPPMLDLVLAVKSPTEWHAANLEWNPRHYSALRWLGAETIARIQGACVRVRACVSIRGLCVWWCGCRLGTLSDTRPPTTEDYGAALYYNMGVPVPGQPGRAMKYGVMSTHALRRDLVDWAWMYAAGEWATD